MTHEFTSAPSDTILPRSDGLYDIEKAAREFCAEGCEGDSGTYYPTDDAKWFLTQFVNGLPTLYTWSSIAEPMAMLSPRDTPVEVANPAGVADEITCPHCDGRCEWFTHRRNGSGVVDGRLKATDVECIFVLGCTECGETIKTCTADAMADRLNALSSPGR